MSKQNTPAPAGLTDGEVERGHPLDPPTGEWAVWERAAGDIEAALRLPLAQSVVLLQSLAENYRAQSCVHPPARAVAIAVVGGGDHGREERNRLESRVHILESRLAYAEAVDSEARRNDAELIGADPDASWSDIHSELRREFNRLRSLSSRPPGGSGERSIAEEVLRCAAAWEPDARLIGNVRAADIALLARYVLASQPLTPARGSECEDELRRNAPCGLSCAARCGRYCRIIGDHGGWGHDCGHHINSCPAARQNAVDDSPACPDHGRPAVNLPDLPPATPPASPDGGGGEG